jgi:uncharacterized protein (DUF58 family)
MPWRALLPTRAAVLALAALAVASGVALMAGAALDQVAPACGMAVLAGLIWTAFDIARARRMAREDALRIERRAPSAFALGVASRVRLVIFNESSRAWRVRVFDEADPSLAVEGMPQDVDVPPNAQVEVTYTVTPTRRGPVRFGGTQLRWRSPGGVFEVQQAAGQAGDARVYPNFAAVAGYAWLAGDRRLSEIGIKQFAQRGAGTDFRQLRDYTPGDPIRHIDWKASLRQGKPVVREFQDERDQRVFFLLDCGRRMRADESGQRTGGSHFDQALNALMLLGYVALKEGDEVGAMTFGTSPGQERHFAPRKGVSMLNALVNRLYDVEPEPVHSDYLRAAREFMSRHPRRAFVIMLTNFRGDDAAELRPALRMLRQRHLVMVASLRETVLREIAQQPIMHADDAVEVAAAHRFAQQRHDAFLRTTGNDPLSVDIEPAALPAALVNRYHAVKRAGLL